MIDNPQIDNGLTERLNKIEVDIDRLFRSQSSLLIKYNILYKEDYNIKERHTCLYNIIRKLELTITNNYNEIKVLKELLLEQENLSSEISVKLVNSSLDLQRNCNNVYNKLLKIIEELSNDNNDIIKNNDLLDKLDNYVSTVMFISSQFPQI